MTKAIELTNDQKEFLLENYHNYSNDELCKIYGFSREKLRKVAKKIGVKLSVGGKRKKISEEEIYKKTPCVCPRCSVSHIKILFWTGKLPARVMCNNCSDLQDYKSQGISSYYF